MGPAVRRWLIGLAGLAALIVGLVLSWDSRDTAPPPERVALPIFEPAPSFGSGDNVPGTGPVTRPASEREASVPGELVLSFDPGTPASTPPQVFDELGVTPIRQLASGAFVVELAAGLASDDVIVRARAIDSIRYTEPNFIYRAADRLPNDPRMGSLWGLENAGQLINGTTGTADADIDAAAAWDFTTGSYNIKVAVVDSGVAYGHPDLAANIWSNPNEAGAAATDGIDNDGNGLVDDFRGWDWVANDNNPQDENGHGTHVAGTIGARGNDATGVTGVNWQVSLMPLRVLDAQGSGSSADVADGMAYAVAKGAKVVNLSLGGPSLSTAIRDVITSSPQTLFVIAAGNAGTDNEVTAQYPCNLIASNVICVAASTQRDGLATFSNYGATSVDLAAPGVNILSTVPGADGSFGLAYYQGTSMATPQVAGAAALLWAAKESASVAEIKSALLGGAEARAAFTGKMVTGGRLNVMAALTRLTGATAPAPATTLPGAVSTTLPAASPSPSATTVVQPTTTVPPTSIPPSPSPSPSPSGTVATPTPSPPPSAGPTPTSQRHVRKISLQRPRPLVARGRVGVLDAFNQCRSGVPVTILRNGRRIARVRSTHFGFYRAELPRRRGNYVAVAPLQELLPQILCDSARSDQPPPSDFTDDPTADPTAPDAAEPNDACWTYDPAEEAFADKINEARVASGQETLRLDPELSRAARAHTEEMVRGGTLVHTTSAALSNRVTRWSILGENVGVGGSVETLQTAFMNSPAHRDNILLPGFRYVGIGTYQAPDRLWVTVIFESTDNPGTSLSMPGC
ncbi:MAG: hypothetical protein QOH26_895 [Actinomycetota bacterium]|nr:hypothetical protein [Actinomycetota bacterium]